MIIRRPFRKLERSGFTHSWFGQVRERALLNSKGFRRLKSCRRVIGVKRHIEVSRRRNIENQSIKIVA